MNLTKRIIAFNHGKVYTSLETPQVPTGERERALRGLTKELGKFGYIISNKALLRMSIEDATETYNEVIPVIAELYHEGENFVHLFQNFPSDVFNMSNADYEKFQEAIYTGKMTVDEFIAEQNSWYSDKELKDIEETSEDYAGLLKTFEGMTEDEFAHIPVSIMSSGMSITDYTREELKWFLENTEVAIPETIPFKETQCIVMSLIKNYHPRDINDVLRFGIYLMGGSPSLVNVPKMIKQNYWSGLVKNPEWRRLSSLKRKDRKAILEHIEAILSTKPFEAVIADAKRFYGHWVLLSERVHCGDYKEQFPNAAKFFTFLQTKETSKTVRTWESKVQKMYNTGADILDITKFVSSRPGEFVRRLDSLIRRASKENKGEDVMDIFLETPGMRNKTLLELLGYYDRRVSGCPRMISVKGSRVKKVIPGVESIPTSLVEFIQDVIARKILINIDSRTKEKDLVGKTVYLDPEINKIPIPTDMKSRTAIIPAGTRIPITGNVIRFFVHWKQNAGIAEDLDLHSMFLNDAYVTTDAVGFNSSKSIGDCVAFSGDVLNRPGDCAEYVDIDLSKIDTSRCRYATMLVNNFKGRGFNTLPCWLGFSEISKPEQRNQTWTPQNVQYCQPITSTCTHIAAMVVDTLKREVIFIDSDLSQAMGGVFNEYQSVARYYTVEHKFTTRDVLKRHYESRGAMVVSDMPAIATEQDPSGINPDDLIEVVSGDIIKDYTKVLEVIGE